MPSRSRTFLLIALILLTLGLFFLSWSSFPSGTRHSPPQPRLTSAPTSTTGTSPAPDSTSPTNPAPPAPKASRIHTRGTVHLRPGETAVASCWEFEPGKYGLTLVTPEPMPDGNVKLTIRILNVAAGAVEHANARDLMPDIFETDRLGAADSGRLEKFYHALTESDVTNIMSLPILSSRPGQPIHVHSIVNTPGRDWSGYKLNLQADTVDGDAGYDLSVNIEKQAAAVEPGDEEEQ